MARGDRVCFVCGKNYHYCTCHGGNPNETWRFLFCSENCRSVEKIWEEYFRDNLITKSEAVARISNLDTSRMEFYREQVKDDIKYLTNDILTKVESEMDETNKIIEDKNIANASKENETYSE